MSLYLHIIVTYIKENIIAKLQKLYSPPRNPRVGNKSPALFVIKPLCTGNLSPTCKIFIERPASWLTRGRTLLLLSVFSEHIGMKFGIEKCAILVMEKRKIVTLVGIVARG